MNQLWKVFLVLTEGRGKKKGQLRLKKKVIGKVLNENVKVVLEMLSDSRASRPRAFARNKLYG